MTKNRVMAGTILYHGTTWHLGRGDFFTSFDPSVEIFVTASEPAAEFFAGDHEDPSGDPVVLLLFTKRDIFLSDEKNDENVDGFTRSGRVSGLEYDDTLILRPNDVLSINAYKVKKRGKWSSYHSMPPKCHAKES